MVEVGFARKLSSEVSWYHMLLKGRSPYPCTWAWTRSSQLDAHDSLSESFPWPSLLSTDPFGPEILEMILATLCVPIRGVSFSHLLSFSFSHSFTLLVYIFLVPSLSLISRQSAAHSILTQLLARTYTKFWNCPLFVCVYFIVKMWLADFYLCGHFCFVLIVHNACPDNTHLVLYM